MKIKLLFLLIFLPYLAFSQHQLLQLNAEERYWYENALLRDSQQVHRSIRPWRTQELRSYSRKADLLPDTVLKKGGFGDWLVRKALYEDLLSARGEDYYLSVNPIVHFRGGNEAASDFNPTYRNSRGVRLEVELGKVSAYSTLVETQARLPAQVQAFVQQNRGVVPGYWLSKSFNRDGRDYAYATGEIAYTPNANFHFRLGQGKQFIGEGYRSMLISDNTVNYPFFRMETSFWKFRYVNTWAILNDLRPSVQRGDIYGKKYLSMHYLSINIGQRLNLGLFEGIMWGDELNRYGFDLSFLNPVILYRPLEFKQGFRGGNTLMGLQASYQFKNGMLAYGQMALDEFNSSAVFNWSEGNWVNMMAWQLGLKWGDALGIRNLFLRSEYNIARPYTYAHREIITNWGHYQQPLAHPWGANFEEFLLRAHYRTGRWSFLAALHYGDLGRDAEDENWGGDIYQSWESRPSNTGVFVGQGQSSDLTYFRIESTFTLNPRYNLQLHAGYQNRSETATVGGFPDSRWWYVGLRTNVYDSYQDF